MPKNENYITIFGWMVNELQLKGNELLVYAMIYGFSQDGESEFKGSANYIKDWLGVASRKTVVNTLTSLTEKGLLEKRDEIINGVKFCRYKAVNNTGCVKTTQGVCKNYTGGCVKTTHNNTNTNITKYKNSNRAPTKNKTDKFGFEGRDYDYESLEEQLLGL